VDEQRLTTLANRVVSKFRGRFPASVTERDAFNDAVVLLLELEKQVEARKPVPVSEDAWLFTRAHGDLKDRYARQYALDSRVRPHSTAAPDSILVVDQGEPDPDVIMDVREAVEKLSEPARTVMKHTLAGKTQVEIAALMGISQSYVSRFTRIARDELQTLLRDYSATG